MNSVSTNLDPKRESYYACITPNFFSDHFPDEKGFSCTQHFNMNVLLPSLFKHLFWNNIYYLMQNKISESPQSKVWWHHLLWTPSTVVFGRNSCCTGKMQSNLSDKYTRFTLCNIWVSQQPFPANTLSKSIGQFQIYLLLYHGSKPWYLATSISSLVKTYAHTEPAALCHPNFH